MSDSEPLVLSPCIGICKLKKQKNGVEICKGCFRTLDEIVNWSRYSSTERLQVIDRVKEIQDKNP